MPDMARLRKGLHSAIYWQLQRLPSAGSRANMKPRPWELAQGAKQEEIGRLEIGPVWWVRQRDWKCRRPESGKFAFAGSQIGSDNDQQDPAPRLIAFKAKR